MQSPAAANIQLPSLLDLLGTGAPTTAAGPGPSAFDTLLQPNASAPPPSLAEFAPQRTPRGDRTPQWPPPHEDRPAPRPPDPDDRPTSNDHTQSRAERPPPDDSAASPEVSDDTARAASDEPELLPQEQVVAESLAGLSTVAVALIAENPAAEAASEERPGDPVADSHFPQASSAGQGSEHSTNRSLPGAAAGPAASSSPEAIQLATSDIRPPDSTAASLAQARITERNSPGSPTNNTAASDSLTASTSEQPLPLDSIPPIEPVGETQTRNEKSQPEPEPEPGTMALDSAPVSANSTAAAPQSNAHAAPIAVVAPSASTMPDAPRATATTSANGSIAPSTQQRSRLPAEVLAPGPRHVTQGDSAPIDTVRLLSRVAKAFAAAGERDGEVHLRLSPPELGSLRLEVRVQDGALVAHLHTETDSARTAILDNLPALRERLAEQGVRIERFDVDLMQRQPGGTPDQPGGRQQEPPAQVRTAPTPQARTENVAAPAAPAPPSSTAAGLNIIV